MLTRISLIFLQSVALLMPNSCAALTLFPLFFSKLFFTISASAFSKGVISFTDTDKSISSCLSGQFLGEAIHLDPVSSTDDEGMFNNVFEFPNIPGKIVVQEQSQGLIGYAGDLFSHFGIKLLNKGIDQQGDILPSLGKGRHFDLNHVESVVEIVSELSLVDQS